MPRIRRPSPAVVVACISLFVALGSTALAAVVITSNSQVARDTISGHKPPSGKHANIIAGSVNGKDIADRSGVDTCKAPLTIKFGPICAGGDGVARDWANAVGFCTDLGLRLPSISEAVNLAKKYDVPGVAPGDKFWTDDYFEKYSQAVNNFFPSSVAVSESGSTSEAATFGTLGTVCVTDPSA
jgi:hypothetical protein